MSSDIGLSPDIDRMPERKQTDRGGPILALALVVLVNVLANTVPIGGQTTGGISARYPTLFTPAGFTFSIWSLIYLSLIGFVVYQALPGQRRNPDLTVTGRRFIWSCLANIGWIFSWHYDQIALSLVMMGGILLSLASIYSRVDRAAPSLSSGFRLFVRFPFRLYTGWITVAAIANLSVVQVAWGWQSLGTTEVNWTLLKLALAGAIASTVVVRRGDIAFALVVAWAALGISVKQQATPEVSGAAAALCFLAVLLALRESLKLVCRKTLG